MSSALQMPPARVVIAKAKSPKPIRFRVRVELECSASIFDLPMLPETGLQFKHFAELQSREILRRVESGSQTFPEGVCGERHGSSLQSNPAMYILYVYT